MSEIKKYIKSRFGEKGFIVEADLSQIEVVVQAFLSGDPAMISDIKNKIDFHSKRAAFKLKETYEAVWKAVHIDKVPFYILERKKAKSFSFQRAFGAGAPAIADAIGITIDEAKDFIKMEEELYPNVVVMQNDWIEEVQRSAYIDKDSRGRPKNFTEKGRIARTGKLKSITGREYTFIEEDSPDWLSKRSGKLVGFRPTRIKNYAIQGLAGEILRIILGRVYRKLKASARLRNKALLVNTIHDSILLDIHESVLNEVCRLLKETMESVPELLEKRFGFKMDVPVSCDIEYGRNWADLEEWKDDN